MDYKDYYKILGVPKTATKEEIKKAYRKLAAKHHPDVQGGGGKASTTFTDIGEAYEVLKDPEKRKLYDKVGKNWKQYQQAGVDPDNMGGGFGGFQQGGQGGGQSYRYSSQQGSPFGSREGGFSDFFESIFGGGGSPFEQQSPFEGGTGTRSRSARRGADISLNATISMEEAITGTTRSVQIGEEKVNLKIPPGTTSGKKLKLTGKGQYSPDGSDRGDLIIKVTVEPHDRYSLEDGRLYLDQPVDVAKLMLGDSIEVQTPEKQIKLNISEGTQSGKVYRIPGMGFPEFKKPDEKGPLYVRLNAHIPERLTPEQKELIRQAFPGS